MTLMPRRLGGDYVWGNVDSRELKLRPIAPIQMSDWCRNRGFRFAIRKTLVVRNWWRAAKDRSSWAWSWRIDWNASPRCWCPDGCRIFWRVAVCGFGFVFIYSRFTGSMPCPCDKVMEDDSNA